ncbi:MAG: BMP family ABC transporter substrate-binding protein [Candidatus Nanopelagicaceae bacterium]|nr:BMP family ABC transporter substrate-binding protein [Candidatus Nanopelagicaceae bacterium]
MLPQKLWRRPTLPLVLCRRNFNTYQMKLRALLLIFTLIFSAVSPARAENPSAKVAVAYDIGFLGDNSFNDAVNEALVTAKKKYNLVEPFIREVPTNGSAVDRLSRLRFLAQNGYNLVIAVGSGYRETVRRVSMEYPDIQFALINDKAIGQMNVSNIYFREDHGAYLSGVIAATFSKKKSIGFIGSDPDLFVSFSAGARAISKTIRVVNIAYPDSLAALKSGLGKIDVGYSTWDGDATVLTTVLDGYAKKVKLIVERPDQYFSELNSAQSVILASINKNLTRPIDQLVGAALAQRSIIDVVDEKEGIYGREYSLRNRGVSFTMNAPISSTQRARINLEIKKFLANPKSK